MWLSERSRKKDSRESPADVGVVTLSGDETAVYVTGERRNLQVLGPGGYYWRPADNSSVLVLKTGADSEQSWVLGTNVGPGLEPGEIWIQGQNVSIFFGADGSMDLRGKVLLDGTDIYDIFELKNKEGG